MALDQQVSWLPVDGESMRPYFATGDTVRVEWLDSISREGAERPWKLMRLPERGAVIRRS